MTNAPTTSSAEERLTAAVAQFADTAAQPADRMDSLHNMIVAMHGVCGALAFASSHGIAESRIHELAAVARRTAAISPFVHRLQNWPRGYPGDFETVEYIVEQRVRTPPNTSAYLIELHSLTSAIVQQHRNKVAAQARRIIETIETAAAKSRILVLAAGGSPDLRLALPVLKAADVQLVLVDADADALTFSKQKLAALEAKIVTVQENLVFANPLLHEYGPFDLVLAGGLFDYLPTKYAVALLRAVDRSLAPAGKLFFTNMTDPNPYAGWMRHVANWRVIERSPAVVEAMLTKACGQPIDVTIDVDGTGLALLVTYTKR